MTVTNKERGVSFFDAEGNPSPLPRGWCLGCGTQPSLRLRGFPGKDRRRSTGENGVSQYAGSKGWRSRCEVLDLSSHFGSDPDACPKMRVDDPRVLGDSRLLSLEGQFDLSRNPGSRVAAEGYAKGGREKDDPDQPSGILSGLFPAQKRPLELIR